MRNDKLIPGTVLVIIGTLFLLDNFNYIDFDWFSLFRLWPILLVIAGVNLVFAYNHSGTATAIKIAVLVAGMAFLIFNGIGHPHHYNRHNWKYAFKHFDFNDNESDSDNDDDSDSTDTGSVSKNFKSSNHYQAAYKPSTKQATLNISGGATSYVLKDMTTNLFEADTKESGNHYSLTSTDEDDAQTLDFDMNGDNNHRHGFVLNFGNDKSDKAYLKLNTNPEWTINVEAGAAKINFDLSAFKVQKVKLEGGAASFNVKMGQPLAETTVDVSTGISKVVISVPRNAACHITSETGVSSKSFKGFESVGDDEYETPNFSKATNKMYLKISGGISDFKVEQY
ncbi:hypothetical protein BDD43_5342 [Mucilaginibacter gracilis]|uniref:LiaI-LiaF-like transmembrane region domain-containing protein n=1 Tax=Mucilaginibacter gracilis TaxID=423350 RepID=A0A495J7X2_9SPHI|nr:DUF5668 domain-containing protein [Mucilaginibacter gracilis]RKR85086.1 hypothetical protein BDD43_5342 [Mucilaginibacter gracilis]